MERKYYWKKKERKKIITIRNSWRARIPAENMTDGATRSVHEKTTGKEPVGNSAARPWDCHVRKICQNPPSMLCPWSYIIPFNRRNETFIRVYILFLTLWSRWLSSCSVDDSIYLSLSLSLYTYSFFFLVNNSHHLFHWVSILSYLSWPFAVFFS